MFYQCRFTGISSKCFKTFLLLVILVGWNSPAVADVCVWRDPERTMQLLFPEAMDYRTIDRKIPPDTLVEIERRLGRPLDPGERKDWTYYELVGSKGKKLGYVIADAEKGEYGVIEIVMGLSVKEKVVGVYIQRSRERKTRKLKSKEFLSQFIGKGVEDGLETGKDIRAVDGAEAAAKEVAFGVKKMLVFYDEIGNSSKGD